MSLRSIVITIMMAVLQTAWAQNVGLFNEWTETEIDILKEALEYGLPVIVVNTVNDEEPTAEPINHPEGCLGTGITNATKVPGRVRIYFSGDVENPDFDSGEYEEGQSGMTFKIRGNSSANSSKKPFKIKLQKKADLLLRGDKNYNDKEWALIRPTGGDNYPCPIVTMVGNKVTEILKVSEWIPASMYVNLIVNGNYRGFYQLTETVKRNEKCRIDVDKTTGYISELDPYWWNEDLYVESSLLKKNTNNTYKFTFKYPDSDDITQEQLTIFKEYLDLFDASIAKGFYPLYLNVESCARWLLAHQILGTLDSAGSNIYFIRRDNQSKFEMGPLWDFDSILRIQGDFTPIVKVHYFKQMLKVSPNKMLAREMQRIWGEEKEQIVSELADFFNALEGSKLASAIDKSTKANIQRWPHNTLDNMETTLYKLREWFSSRVEDIDSLIKTLNTVDGTIQWKELPEGTITLQGREQPVAGSTLSLSIPSGIDLPQLSFKWTKGDALGTFDDTIVLSSTKDYVITESDYEHWLRVTVSDNAGNTLFTKDTWISKLPVLYIDTEDGSPITSKTDYVTAKLRIQGNAEYVQQYTDSIEIRGRGTTSWAYPQKPYKLKLDKETNLFGFGISKHWALIPNFNDKSCLRNYTASRLAKQLGIIGMDMTWVDVVLNGEVKGCYMLSQHVRVDKNSVDIFNWEGEAEDIADDLFNLIKDADVLAKEDKKLLETTMEQNLSWVTDGKVIFKNKTYNLSDYDLKKQYDISKGYLFEATAKKDGKTQFTTPGNVHFEVSTPEYLNTNSEMFSFVTGFWNDFEAEYSRVPTVDSTKNFSKYANMESMIGVWLVNEIMGQGDLANSRYSYIASDGKLYFGPVWNFDHGGGSWSTVRDVNFFYTLIHKLDYTYYKKWFPDPVLCQMAYDAYWNVARPFMMDYLSEGSEMDKKYALFAEAGKTNDVLWGDKPNTITPSAEPRTAVEDVEILRTFLLGHIEWLDQQFASIKTLVEAMNSVCTYPYNPETITIKLQELTSEKQLGTRKVIRDNHLYIIKNGNTYSVEGKRIR